MPKPTNAPSDILRELYQALSGDGARELEPDHPYYVPILEATPAKDPILDLAQRIEWSPSASVNLLTGLRGNGKSTQLRRLRRLLQQSGCRVFLVDMLEYMLMTKPVELSDFLLSLMAGLAAQVRKETGLDRTARSYSERLLAFLKTDVEIEELKLDTDFGGGNLEIGARLRSDPVFKQRLQQHLRGHLTKVVQDAQRFGSELVDAVRKDAKNPNLKVVLLVDSTEQLRGVGDEAQKVHESAVELFSGQAANLSFPKLHVVYTIPPFLIPLAPNLGRSFGGGRIAVWPNIHVRTRDGGPDAKGLAVMREIIAKRHAKWSDVISSTQLDRLASSSGGDVRDFFRLVRDVTVVLNSVRRENPQASIDDSMVVQVEQNLRNEFLPIAEEDRAWYARIRATKEASLPSIQELPRLARFFDSNVIMNYLNGEPWYDVHPLLADEIEPRTSSVRKKSRRG